MKRIICLSLCLLVLTGAMPAAAAAPRPSVRVGGRALEGQGYIVSDISFVPLREVCESLGYTVVWHHRLNGAVIYNGDRCLYLRENSNLAQTPDGEFALGGRCFMANGTLYAPARGLAKGLGVSVFWEDATRTVVFGEQEPSRPDPDEVYWLSRIISAEAQGESLEGMAAVGSVVLNRVRSPLFPNTIYGVIFDRRFGVQFTPVANGRIYDTPTEDAVKAAQMCLGGYDAAPGCLYFFNPVTSTAHHWIMANRTYSHSVGNHDFYY